MEMENYLLQRARLILNELLQEYQRVQKLDQTGWHVENNIWLEAIKLRMIEVEEGIRVIEMTCR